MDPKTFSSASWKDTVRGRFEDENSKKVRERFRSQGGFAPTPNVASLDDPRHREGPGSRFLPLFDEADQGGRIHGNARHGIEVFGDAIRRSRYS